MKVTTAVAAIAAGAAIASASPLRVVVVSTTPNGMALPRPEPFVNMRLGHAVPHNADPNAAVAHMISRPGSPGMPLMPPHPHHGGHMGMMHGGGGKRPGCAGGRFRAKFNEKAIEIANGFRKAFGLPLIEAHNPHTHKHHGDRPTMIQIVPMHGGHGGSTMIELEGGKPMKGGWWGHTKGGEKVQVVAAGQHPHPHSHHNHHQTQGSKGPVMESSPADGFFDRFMAAIMSLGPWEGRAVAFVIGAGIGVLIRMFWVLGVVMFRGIKAERRDYYEEVAVTDEDDDDVDGLGRRTPASAPPQYVYPVDEKIVYAQEVPKKDDSAPAQNN